MKKQLKLNITKNKTIFNEFLAAPLAAPLERWI
jgi:hypothetical protein